MKNLFKFAFCALITACGLNDSGNDYSAEELDLMDMGQSMTVRSEGPYQHGTRNSSTALACNDSSSGQICIVPRNVQGNVSSKSISWAFAPAPANTFIQSQKQTIRDTISSLDSELANWTFVEENIATIVVARAVVSGSSTSSNIDAFRGVQFSGLEDMSEGSGVVGGYKTHNGCTVTIDVDDIQLRTGGGTEFTRLMNHLVSNGVQACLGLGTRDDTATQGRFLDRTVVVPAPTSRNHMNVGSRCRVNSYNPFTNQSQFDIQTPKCTDQGGVVVPQ